MSLTEDTTKTGLTVFRNRRSFLWQSEFYDLGLSPIGIRIYTGTQAQCKI